MWLSVRMDSPLYRNCVYLVATYNTVYNTSGDNKGSNDHYNRNHVDTNNRRSNHMGANNRCSNHDSFSNDAPNDNCPDESVHRHHATRIVPIY